MEKLALMGGPKLREKPFVTTAIIADEERRRVNEVLDSGILSGFVGKAGPAFLGGKQVKEFEGLAKEYFDVNFAVAVNSATAGLHAALVACGVNQGDEVIVPPYTMSASAAAVLMANGIPVFCDIDDVYFALDPKCIESKITSRTKAIVVVHLFGKAALMDQIMAIADRHHLRVVEDCAQAPGATFKDQLVGTFGDVGILSLNQHKTITCGEGGVALTNDERLALRLQLVRNHGEAVVGDLPRSENDSIVGYNYRMTELEAAVSYGQFKRLDELNDHRIDLAEHLTKRLRHFKGLTLPHREEDSKHVYFVYPIRFDEKIWGIPRSLMLKALVAEGILFGAGYIKPLYLEPLYQTMNLEYDGAYEQGICPVVERLYNQELMMTPVCRYPHTKTDMDDVVNAFDKVFYHLDELKRGMGDSNS